MFTLPQLKSTLTIFLNEARPWLPQARPARLLCFTARLQIWTSSHFPATPHRSINPDTCGSGLSSSGIDLSFSYWPAASHDPWPLRVEPPAVWTSSSLTWPPITSLWKVQMDCSLLRMATGLHCYLNTEPPRSSVPERRLWLQNSFCDYIISSLSHQALTLEACYVIPKHFVEGFYDVLVRSTIQTAGDLFSVCISFSHCLSPSRTCCPHSMAWVWYIMSW